MRFRFADAPFLSDHVVDVITEHLEDAAGDPDAESWTRGEMMAKMVGASFGRLLETMHEQHPFTTEQLSYILFDRYLDMTLKGSHDE